MVHRIPRRVVLQGALLGGLGTVAGAVALRSTLDDEPNLVVPDVVADGKTDDREAINEALASIPHDGRHWRMHLPGLCYVGEGPISGGMATGVIVPRGNVTLTCSPGGGVVTDSSNIRLLVIAGGAIARPRDPLSPADWWTSLPVVVLRHPVPAGSRVIALSTDAHGLKAGDDVFIRSGQLVAGLDREPDAELNQVAAVSGAEVTLRRPTAKAYTQEYFLSGDKGFTSTSGPGASAPFGVARVTDKVMRGVRIAGWQIRAGVHEASESTAVHIQSAQDVEISGCRLVFGKYGVSARYARDVRLVRQRLWTPGNVAGDPVFVAASTGCGDWLVEGVRASGVAPGKLHAHEGVHDLRVRDWRQRTPDGPGKPGASNISIRARAYRHTYDLDVRGYYLGSETTVVKASGDVYFERLSLAPGARVDRDRHLRVELGPGVRLGPAGCECAEGLQVLRSPG